MPEYDRAYRKSSKSGRLVAAFPREAACAAHLVSFGSELDVNLIRNILPVDDGSEAVYRKYMLELQPQIGDIE